jgi:hypothetical protein
MESRVPPYAVPAPVSTTSLRIRFDDHGVFSADVRVTVDLDGRRIYDGGFAGGFEIAEEVEPGPHTLKTAIHLALFRRTREYRIEISPPGYRDRAGVYEARLEYSRAWGNFVEELEIERS